jgi:hypothetical protein
MEGICKLFLLRMDYPPAKLLPLPPMGLMTYGSAQAEGQLSCALGTGIPVRARQT